MPTYEPSDLCFEYCKQLEIFTKKKHVYSCFVHASVRLSMNPTESAGYLIAKVKKATRNSFVSNACIRFAHTILHMIAIVAA